MTDQPNDQPVVIRHELLDFLPVDTEGRMQRAEFLSRFHLSDWEHRPTITSFAGSRNGSNPAYIQEVHYLSNLIQRNNWGLVTGGAPDEKLGLMSGIADQVQHLIGVSPSFFADLRGPNTGISPRATNFITEDFYTRKAVMDVLTPSASLMLFGGYGTLEEGLEALIFGAKTGKSLHILNTGGFWSPFITQLATLRSLGLIDEKKALAEMTVSPTASIAFSHLQRAVRAGAELTVPSQRKGKKPLQSLQGALRENPSFVPQQIFDFIGNDAPRVGMILSGNISADSNVSKLNNRTLSKEFCEQSKRVGQEIAQGGGVLVLSGERSGLREIMAESALEHGGKVIWIRKASSKDGARRSPIHVSRFDRELTFTVAREFEKAMLFDLIAESKGFFAGGVNTLDRVFEVVTREQTGFGGINGYKYMIEGNVAGLPVRESNPTYGYNIGNIWADTQQQVDTFHKNGFIEDKHVGLFQMLPLEQSLAGVLLDNARSLKQGSYDPLKVILDRAPSRPVTVGPVRANQLTR